MWGDNYLAVHYVHRCRGGAGSRSGGLLCLLGVLEVTGSCYVLRRTHAVRLDRTSVPSARQEYGLRIGGRSLSFCVLASGSFNISLALTTVVHLRRLVGTPTFRPAENDSSWWLWPLVKYSSYALMAIGLQAKTIADNLSAVK